MKTMNFKSSLPHGVVVLSLLAGFHTTYAADVSALKASQPKTIRLLTVGNSFSGNATKHLADLARAGGCELIHRTASVGGASLELHVTKVQAHERDPAVKAGLYAAGLSLTKLLRAERWDFVTIQQASIKSHDLATYRPFAEQLRDTIRTHAPQAKLLVHQTWAYRRDDPRFTKTSGKAGEPVTHEAMYRGLTTAYRTIAEELGARVIPVGDAFFLADTDSQWGYQPDPRFDFKAAQPPALPDQTHSLHIGWRWRKQKDGAMKLVMDGHHANTAGEYLGACVWYEVLFGASAVGNSFAPPGLDPAFARFLQETAHHAVVESAKPPPPR
ncbi:MAG: DUF4886 domain-containing protein [Verrucomicrobiota bacterium]|nr:DUF4886 domain-containing protein [Verrucomicrobiota bacterium]